MIFDWITGRSLSKITKGNTELEMMYDCNGMRTQKGIGDDVTKYYYDSSNNLIGLTNGNNTLFFYYDSYGMSTSFAHNGTMYYYVKNLQGDIVQITKQDGTVVAKYIYDVWGKILSIKDGSNNIIETTNVTHLANLNPFRYRGYVYDNETGLYYLQSRYYDPITGRFLNADETDYIKEPDLSLIINLYVYCDNNAIRYVDKEGKYKSYNYNIYNFNCYSYAFGVYNKWMQPGHTGKTMSKSFSLSQTVSWVLKDFGSKVRKLNSKDSSINKGEYRIAMRILTQNSYRGDSAITLDFHFWKQNPNNLHWWNKHGTSDMQALGKVNPNTTKQKGWKYTDYTGKTYYYNSKTAYFAYKGKFWSR